MKIYEQAIKLNDLMVEFWWEAGHNEFRATVRKDMADEGWAGSGDGVETAIIMAVSVFIDDTKVKAAL